MCRKGGGCSHTSLIRALTPHPPGHLDTTARNQLSYQWDIAQAPTFLARFFVYTEAVEAISNYPWLSNAKGATITFPFFIFETGFFEPITTWTMDSLYLSLIFKMGVVGLISFMWLSWRLLRLAYRTFVQRLEPQAKAFGTGAFAILCGFAVLDIRDASRNNGRSALVYATLWAWLWCLPQKRQTRASQ